MVIFTTIIFLILISQQLKLKTVNLLFAWLIDFSVISSTIHWLEKGQQLVYLLKQVVCKFDLNVKIFSKSQSAFFSLNLLQSSAFTDI